MRCDNCRRVDPYWLSTLQKFEFLPVDLAVIPGEYRQLLRDLVAELQSGRPATACHAFLASPLADPDSPLATEVLTTMAAGVHGCLGNFPAAHELMERLMERGSRRACTAYNAGLVKLRLQGYEEATALFQAAVAQDPQLGPAWSALAVIYGLEQAHPEAELAARNAIRLCRPVHPLANLVLLQSTYRQRKPVEGGIAFSSVALEADSVLSAVRYRFPKPSPVPAGTRAGDGPVFFIYADDQYFRKHGVPLVLSLHDVGFQGRVHLHVCNPAPDAVEVIQRVGDAVAPLEITWASESVSVESISAPPIYHSCLRFVRMYEFCRSVDVPVVMVDADALANRSPADLLALVDPQADVIVTRADHEPFWSAIRGCFLMVRPTVPARDFLGKVAAFVLDNIEQVKGRWFLDQIALHAVCEALGPSGRIGELSMALFGDREFSSDKLFWNAVNQDKVSDNPYTRRSRDLLRRYDLGELAARGV